MATTEESLEDFTLFEEFVSLTDGAWWFIQNFPFISTLVSAAMVLTVWMIFVHHRDILSTDEFFENNLPIAGRFCSITYDSWKILAVTLLPVMLYVIWFSLKTKGRTEPFIAKFGLRGSSKTKERLIKLHTKKPRK